MIYEIKDMSKVKNLFEGWQETLIYSCLQNVMGKIYVTDLLSLLLDVLASMPENLIENSL